MKGKLQDIEKDKTTLDVLPLELNQIFNSFFLGNEEEFLEDWKS